MNANLVVTIVVALVAAFGATGIAALLMVPKQRQQMDATSTYQLTQSVVLASQELDRLRAQVRDMSSELDREKRLREVAEARVREWTRLYPPPAGLVPPPGNGGT